MKLIAQTKLLCNEDQKQTLLATMRLVNATCDQIGQTAWDSRKFGRSALQKLCYLDAKGNGLTAQMAIHATRKVADAYKKDKKTIRQFRPTGAITFDDRVLSWKPDQKTISIWTTEGRQTIPFVCGERQEALLTARRGESDLVYRKGEFYLLATCDVRDIPVAETGSFLGVDLGVVNIATDSEGLIHKGNMVNNVRYRHRVLRGKLQKKGSRSAKRKLKRLSGKESCFARDVNHCISKSIVAKAQDTGKGVALEDLTHIRNRITARRRQRATLHSWSFGQLRAFISYKAESLGIPVVLVDPRNTSRECPACGHTSKNNRKSQASFCCTSCGFAGIADVIAAGNIARRAEVSRPNVAEAA